MSTTQNKPKTEIRAVKHVFTAEEIAEMNVRYRMADKTVHSLETEQDSVKASYKAKITEAESRKEKIGTELDAGFEIRDKNCVVVMDFNAGEKRFYLDSLVNDLLRKDFLSDLDWPLEMAVITEKLTDDDRQQELLAAEAKFECREVVRLFEDAGEDAGTMTIGRLDGRWYSALQVKIGSHVITENLADEQAVSKQSGSKKRPDQVKRTLKRFIEWLEETLGREEAKGFKNAVELVKAEQAEREE